MAPSSDYVLGWTLASHGYVVATIAHTHDTPQVIFPDGRLVRAVPQPPVPPSDDSTLPRWRRDLERELRSQEYVRLVNEVKARDLRFALDQLIQYSTNPEMAAPFHGQLDLQRVGALGHSAGGQTAALGCQTDPRIKACLNQDGVMHNLPFQRDALGTTMQQPFMYMGRRYDPAPFSDAALASLEMSRAEADSLFRAIPAAQDALLADLPGGGFRVTLCGPDITHMSFSDEPLIESIADSVRTANALAALLTVGRYTRAFFDKTLLGRADTVVDLDTPDDADHVRVELFMPTAGPGSRSAVPPNEALHLTVACGARR